MTAIWNAGRVYRIAGLSTSQVAALKTEQIGALAARSLVNLLDDGKPTSQIGPFPELAVRGSSGEILG